MPDAERQVTAERVPLRTDLQGLRAIAVIAVVLFHIEPHWLSGGFLGVDVFFVISGYLMASIVLHELSENTFSPFRFYANRIKRVVPAYLVTLALTSIVAAVLLIPQDFGHYKASLFAALLFKSNQYFSGFGDYFAPRAHELPLLHTWSLAIEMQFYLLLPWAVMIVPARFRRWLFPMLLIFAISTPWYADYLTFKQDSYFELSARVPEFLIGASVAALWKPELLTSLQSTIVSCVGIGLILGSCLISNGETTFAGFVALIPCIGAAFLIATPHGLVGRALATPGLAMIGNLSYSIYLWHWPVFAIVRYCTGRQAFNVFEVLVLLVVIVALSILSYRFIETPFRRVKTLGKGAKMFATLAGVTTIVAIGSIRSNAAVVPPLPIAQQRYADPLAVCDDTIIGNCFRGDASSDREWLVIGDSHAAQLNHFFDVVGGENKFKARVITSHGCVNIPGYPLENFRKYAQDNCRAQIDFAKGFVETAERVVIAGLWEHHFSVRNFPTAFEAFLTNADSNKVSIIVLGQLPLMTANVSRAYRLEHLGLPFGVEKLPGWREANAQLAEICSRHPSVRFVDFSEINLFADAPFYRGTLIYYDQSHLNEFGSTQYGMQVATNPVWQK